MGIQGYMVTIATNVNNNRPIISGVVKLVGIDTNPITIAAMVRKLWTIIYIALKAFFEGLPEGL